MASRSSVSHLASVAASGKFKLALLDRHPIPRHPIHPHRLTTASETRVLNRFLGEKVGEPPLQVAVIRPC